jgi:phosphate transport system substrate-binding protein
MKRSLTVFFLCFALAVSSCQREPSESPTKGSLRLVIPESIAPMMRLEVAEFMRLYAANGADVHMEAGTAESAFAQFLADTSRIVFLTRRLTAEERSRIRKTSDDLAEVAVAHDGIAVIVPRSNPTAELSIEELRGILSGSILRWEQLHAHKKMAGRITAYLTDSSDVSNDLRLRLFAGGPIRVPFRHAASSPELIASVLADRSAIGIVGIDWLDSATVRILELSQRAEDADTTFHAPEGSFGQSWSPHPANIYRNYYPLKRTVYLYSKGARADIATGFSSFVAGKEGQRLFLRRNIVPGTQPIRLRQPN